MWLCRNTVFALPVAPQMFRCRGGSLSRAHSGWPSAMHATTACDHSGVVILGGCRISVDCCRFAPTVLATSVTWRHGLLRAYTGQAGRDVEIKLFRFFFRIFSRFYVGSMCLMRRLHFAGLARPLPLISLTSRS